ncbi:MAG: GNAT family N-acetyltransferase [Knoellia sp.]
MAGSEVTSWHSAVESARFGLDIGRVVVGYDVTDAASADSRVSEELRSSTEDLLILRWPAHFTRLGAAVAHSDWLTFPADTLTYWEAAPSALLMEGELEEGLEIVRSTTVSKATEEAIAAVLSDSFAAYGSHYSANPRLDATQGLAGYIEWACAAYRADPGNVILLHRASQPIGVATMTGSDEDLEVELAGLTSAAQGQGLYPRLLAAVGQVAAKEGFSRVIISTQVHNVRVQRAWVRAGMKPFAAVSTVHALRR